MTEDYHPYRYVPSTVSEIKDFLGFMALRCPDDLLDGETIEEAYALLYESLGLLRKKIGEDRYVRLIEMAEQSKHHYDDGEDRVGSALLMNMKDVISGRKASWQ